MIRPVPYVDLPGVVYAIDQHLRTRNREYARFVIAPDSREPRSGVAALLNALLPIEPNVLGWIVEENWRLYGFAQVRARPRAAAWDLAYLAAMSEPEGQATFSQDEILLELLQYALNAALRRGVERVFARIQDDLPEVELFSKVGFQRYARELTYWLPTAGDGLLSLSDAARGANPDVGRFLARVQRRADAAASLSAVPHEIPLRSWSRYDGWGLLRLYDACTPRRVQMVESLTSDEFVATRAGGGRTWYLPFVEPGSVAFVYDRGVRLGGWLRLRFGRGSQPHQLWLMTHPDDPDIAPALLRFGLRVLAREPERAVVCQTREYETAICDALVAAGFSQAGVHALLARHLAVRAMNRQEALALEPRVVYGVRGLGTAPSRLSEGNTRDYATSDH